MLTQQQIIDLVLNATHWRGVFPNVTNSKTTPKNTSDVVNNNRRLAIKEYYFVTRCYSTRHGNGWMSDERNNFEGILNSNFLEGETNLFNEYQGKFRTGLLDIDLINYAIESSLYDADSVYKTHLVTTHVDMLEDINKIDYIVKGKIKRSSLGEMFSQIKLIDRFHICTSAKGNIEEYNL